MIDNQEIRQTFCDLVPRALADGDAVAMELQPTKLILDLGCWIEDSAVPA